MIHQIIKIKFVSRLLFLISLVFLIGGTLQTQAAFADVQTDITPIETAVVQALTFPGQPADANPRMNHVAIVENYALAGWLLGEGGGEMLLQQQGQTWQVISSGGGSMDSSNLIELGVPQDIAVQLLQDLQSQWSKRNTHETP